MPGDEPFREAVRSHVESCSWVAMQNSYADSEEELHPLREVSRWGWQGEEQIAAVRKGESKCRRSL